MCLLPEMREREQSLTERTTIRPRALYEDPGGGKTGAHKEDVQMPSLQILGLMLPEPSKEVARSMVRLRAVPSEKLRVWMVWLNGVGEIADEWHKWLRTHIDLIARMIARRLRTDASDDDVSGGRKIESVINVKSDEISDNVMPTKKEERDISRNLFDESFDEKRANKSPKVTIVPMNEGLQMPETHNPNVRNNERTDDAKDERTTKTRVAASDTAKETTSPVWPMGTTRWWQPLTRRSIERKEDQMETIPKPDMPKNKEEGIEFLKNLTHQATLYRSYYKHWKEIADQATREIACKTVMTTVEFRQLDDNESTMNIADSQAARYSMNQVKSADTHPTEDTTTTTTSSVQPFVPPASPMSNEIDLPTTDTLGRYIAQVSIALSDDQSEIVTPLTEKDRTAEMEAGECLSVKPNVASPTYAKLDATARVTELNGTTKTATMKPIVSITPFQIVARSPKQKLAAGHVAAEKLIIRDMARANEDIPYFFRLRTEPDIEIAREHNDEKVIPAILTRERLKINGTYLYFDLTDGPGMREEES